MDTVRVPITPRISLSTTFTRAVRSDVIRAFLGAHLVAAMVILLYSFAWLQPLGLAVYDALRVSWAGHAVASPPIFLVGASESDLGRWGWPLRDDDLANILERLAAWKPRAIGVDIYRDHPEPPGTDRLAAILAAHPEILWTFKLQEGDRPGVPPPAVLRGTKRAVLADIPVDNDGIARRGLLYADDGVTNYPGMAMALSLAYLTPDGIRLGGAGDGALTLGKATIAPLDEASGPYVRFDGSGYQILLDYSGGARRFPIKTLADIMDHDAAALVRDRIVIVGVASESVKDSFLTPFNTGFGSAPAAYGIAMHGYLADQLIREAVSGQPMLSGFSRPIEDILIWLTALVGAALGYTLRNAVATLAAMGFGLVAILAATYVAFGSSLFLPCVPLVFAWVGSTGLTNRVLYAASNRERARLRRSFEHYLPPSVIADMVASRSLPKVGGERREISVIFTDIANFTTLSETMDPEALALLLNEYFAGACGAVFEQGGLVYEFIGDAILAFFGAPHDQPDHADRAVAAALALDAFAYPFCQTQRERGLEFGITRIGVHTGIALVGNIGTAARLKYTALGDMLNTGSRLEGLNKVIGTRICVSGDTVRKSQRYSFRPIADFVVKGRHGAVSVFCPNELLTADCAPAAEYQAALDKLAAGRPEAADHFAGMHLQYPADPCVAFHHHRLADGNVGTLIVMMEK
jgi:adenylate cyclase